MVLGLRVFLNLWKLKRTVYAYCVSQSCCYCTIVLSIFARSVTWDEVVSHLCGMQTG
uniref:Uncharacterized protein n=1 Tax=Arundo donax TaxID=35708 RepID=A0A0A9H7U0_ARUDO